MVFTDKPYYHDSKSKISIQLGDGKLLSDLLKTDIVYQFRKDDLSLGGEGAPICSYIS